jgi:hypothetical protein
MEGVKGGLRLREAPLALCAPPRGQRLALDEALGFSLLVDALALDGGENGIVEALFAPAEGDEA